ncbi:E3 ubiquitin-protein ligase RBBP6-like [Larus michahellis]|uniref:E3 ubiquitin-protein ligase RBBP6-like n=1 Tax=Larus michahellis TaxID=119627 RepID=UPI003D9B798D
MSCIHYKFAAKLAYDRVIFSGLNICLQDLKRQIMAREKLKAATSDLQISNAQTGAEYTDDNALIAKNSSVIVRRIPVGGVKAAGKTSAIGGTEPLSGTSKTIDDSPAPLSLAQLVKTDNLAAANASEEDKIKAMMMQSCREYNPINYMTKPWDTPPPSYICFRCGKPGHYIKNCPTNGDKNVEPVARIKKSTGIPRSFMMEVKDPNTKGAMLTKSGTYAIPIINAEAYASGKKEKPPFLPAEPSSSSSSSEDPVPDELLCLICKEIMTDAAVIPCCGNSYCDECIRTTLLESEEHTCPTCHQTDVSPDALIANMFLRKAVNSFSNGSGYTKGLHQTIQQQQQPPPPPPALMTMTVAPPGPLHNADSVIPPAALVTAAEPSASPWLSVSSLLKEKVPVRRQPALPSLPGPQGQSVPTTGRHPTRASTPRSAGGRPGWELSKSPYSASFYSRSSCTHSKSRSGSSRSGSYSRSFRRSPSRSFSRSPPYPRRGKGKSRNYHSRSRSPAFRGQSPTKRTIPRGDGERQYFKRYREVPPYDMKAYHGRSVDLRGRFEKERYREWERNYREWYEKFYKGFAAGAQPRPAVNRESISPDRSGPPGTRRENLPYARGRREDSPGGQSHRSHNRDGRDPEKPSGRERHGMKDPPQSNEKDMEYPLEDGKGNECKKHQKRRKGDENKGFPNAEFGTKLKHKKKKIEEEQREG